MARNTSSEPRPRSRRDRSSPWWPALCSCAHRNHQLQNIGRLMPQNKQRNTGGPLAQNTTPTIGPWPELGSCDLGHNAGKPLLDRKIHDLIPNVRRGSWWRPRGLLLAKRSPTNVITETITRPIALQFKGHIYPLVDLTDYRIFAHRAVVPKNFIPSRPLTAQCQSARPFRC